MISWLCMAVIAASSVLGFQDRHDSEPPIDSDRERASQSRPDAGGGFWPTDRMIDSMMYRWVDEAGSRYELDERQQKQWTESLSHRWTEFSHKHRTTMIPITNEFIEMRLHMEPPSAEQVKAWAAKAGPALQLLAEELEAGSAEIRETLKPGQRSKFDTDMMAMNMGMSFAKSKLILWQEGQFNENEFWDPPRRERERQRAERAAQKNDNAAQGVAVADGESPSTNDEAVEPDQIEQELDSWQKYVKQFIEMYKLDESQKATARSILKELSERAVSHRDSHRRELERLEQQIAQNEQSPDELAALDERILELYGPVDELFEQLKSRLENIPTQAQRHGVGKPDRNAKRGN